MNVLPYLIGIVVMFLLLVVYKVLAKTWNPAKLFEGADGKPSSSKFQWFVWTLAVVFAYIVLYVARLLHGDVEPISEIPVNVLLAMGFSVTTMAAAKGITVSYVASGRSLKPAADASGRPAADNHSGLFLDEDGYPDLSKIQMLIWTFIAVVVYLCSVVAAVQQNHLAKLPDVDGALMVLMGLGHGAYLGKKLTTSDQPRLSGLSVGGAEPGTQVTIMGSSFGASGTGNLVTFDGAALLFDGASLTWQDNKIIFPVPEKHPNQQDWPTSKGQVVQVGVIVGGQASANTLPFTVAPKKTLAPPAANP
jgi:hypothetical protein